MRLPFLRTSNVDRISLSLHALHLTSLVATPLPLLGPIVLIHTCAGLYRVRLSSLRIMVVEGLSGGLRGRLRPLMRLESRLRILVDGLSVLLRGRRCRRFLALRIMTGTSVGRLSRRLNPQDIVLLAHMVQTALLPRRLRLPTTLMPVKRLNRPTQSKSSRSRLPTITTHVKKLDRLTQSKSSRSPTPSSSPHAKSLMRLLLPLSRR